MEQTAVKYFAIASVFGMHLGRTKYRLKKTLHLIYSFLFLLTMTPYNFYCIYNEYLEILKWQYSGAVLTVNIFIIVLHITLAVQVFVAFYWLLTKSKDFSQLVEQIDNFADELSCKELLANYVRSLDAIFSILVLPALCALVVAEAFTYTYDYILREMIVNFYGCAAIAIWQWKMILLASSLRFLTSKLNANVKVTNLRLLNLVVNFVLCLQRVSFHPSPLAARQIRFLRKKHADLCNMVERTSNLFQSILALASFNTFLFMVYCAYYFIMAVFDLIEPELTHKRLAVALGTFGWLAFTLANYFQLVQPCELTVYEVCLI